MAVAVEPLLQKCATLYHIKQLQAYLITTGVFQFHPSPRSKFLEFCATSSASGSLNYAADIFRHIAFPVTNDWNAIIRGLAQSHQPAKAVTFYRQGLRMLTCKPDALTCSFTLKACARALACNEAIQIHSQVVQFGFIADILLQTTLLDVYAKSGYLDNARKLFDEMPNKDITCWNAMIAGLAQGNQPNEALHLFKSMKEFGFNPNSITVLGALSACAQLGAVQEGEKIYNYIKTQNLDTNEQVCNVVIDTFGKCGHVKKAHQVFNNMKCKKTLVTYNTMIMIFATNGESHEALKLFNQMNQEPFQPDNVTYLAALCACNHAGLVKNGVELFEKMLKDGTVAPNIKHYGTMVDLLGRSGRLNEAYNLINSIPTSITPDIVLWQTLLGACKTYGNVELAEKASRKLVEMGSSSDGDFVLLSNIYAAQKRWKDVGIVRDTMREKEVIKVPGFSYIEVNGVIHKFVNGDRNHVDFKEIYVKVGEIMSRVMEFGYVAEIGYVLHDIGEEEKENALSYHSEKLAVAFGLVKVKGLIRVNKNLRICGDCHEVMKLVSKVYEREIIVRDRVRFHRFKDGLCSCNDYW